MEILAIILQKDPYSLFYLHFSPYNFTKTTLNFPKIIFLSMQFYI
jgi:hypothetical protein